jgi:DNA ligase-1
MKPMLASDWTEGKVRFPVIVQPKIDGVRALNMTGTLTGRSLKQHANQHVTTLFSRQVLIGMDGEMAAQKETHPDLCRITSSALSTITGEPFVLWWLFDYVTGITAGWAYKDRLAALREKVHDLLGTHAVGQHLRMIPSTLVNSQEELDKLDAMYLDAGYEGTILRDPAGLHKQGKSTVREGGLLRIKRFVDFEFVIDEVIEGEENQNDAQLNELGQTFRSTHQENMIPNGMVGALIGRTLDVVKDGDRVLFEKGQQVRVGAGRMTHDDRKRFFQNKALIVGRIGKGKLFPKGIKDKPRFPTFQSFRDASDMGGES